MNRPTNARLLVRVVWLAVAVFACALSAVLCVRAFLAGQWLVGAPLLLCAVGWYMDLHKCLR